jgi:hypothetical protein
MEPETRSADQMIKKVVEDPARLEALKKDPLPELSKLRDEAVAEVPGFTGDSLLALTAAIGSLVLELGGRTTPEALVALGSAAVGALVGLFVPSPTTR